MSIKSYLKISPAMLVILFFIGISCDNTVGTEELSDNQILTNQELEAGILASESDGTVILYAAQDIPVGEVNVGTSGDKLTVTFEITDDDWCLKETHLHVWGDGDDAPVNNKGNPVPGQFEYSGTHECVGSFPYTTDEDPYTKWNIAAHAVVSNEQGAEETILYGTQRENGSNNGLFKIDLESGTQEFLFNAGGSGNSPNALGFDPVNERLYYMKFSGNDGPSTLYFHELGSNTENEAGLFTDELVVGASFYDGAYYYIPNLTAELHKVTLNSDGTVNEDIILYSDFNGTSDAVYRYGDFAISNDGILYSSSNGTSGSTAEFFKLDIETGVYTLIADENTTNTALGLQVSFGSDGTLFAHNAGSGEFFTVNLDDGVLTSLGSFSNIGLFSDLASGALFILQEETAWGDGERFVEKGNWGTFFMYSADTH